MQRALLASVCFLGLGLIGDGGTHMGNTRTVDVVRSYGYDAEEHTVVTEDGYLLTLTHIKSKGTKMPVLMAHGVVAASDQWVLRGPKNDLAFILADDGHDVWLGDQRGNHFSRRHTYLNTSQPEFWDFSYHESGLYDIPAFIDRVLDNSRSKQLYYIGHSMGTTVYYIMCSMRPQYNKLINKAVHLSPVAFGLRKNLSPLLTLLLANADNIAGALKMQKIYDFLPRSETTQQLTKSFCRNKQFCIFLASQLYGEETAITNNTKLAEYLTVLQSGTSVKTMIHLTQIYKSKNFAQFDYGKDGNIDVYRNTKPPAYPLEKVTSPVALYYSDRDVFVDDHSVGRLTKSLPNVITTASIHKYNHIDVLFADTAAALLYKNIAKLLSKS